MNVLVLGSGGREHALVWKIKQSPQTERIYCAPGNGGIAQLAECIDIKADATEELIAFAAKTQIDLVVVGPELPLAQGIVDAFEEKGFKAFGPRKDAARLEGSKIFAKEFMQRHNVPTAVFHSFSDPKSALAFLKETQYPCVVKADGLAAGKGVIICQAFEDAEQAVVDIMEKKVFKEAGQKIIIEECLKGEEASILAISDGTHFILLDSSQDHKRIFDGDQGPNTGGMGAYSPAPVISQDLLEKIGSDIIAPVIAGMNKEGCPFKGVLYVGLMITEKGPQVLEFNVRFGDPETQAVLPRLKNDLLELMLAACEGGLKSVHLDWDERPCVCVVMASGGYPGSYEKGKEIEGLEEAVQDSQAIVFHAGTKKDGNKIVASGGRVLGVTSLGKDIEEAIAKSYKAVEAIHFEGCFFRRDIAQKALKHAKKITA